MPLVENLKRRLALAFWPMAVAAAAWCCMMTFFCSAIPSGAMSTFVEPGSGPGLSEIIASPLHFGIFASLDGFTLLLGCVWASSRRRRRAGLIVVGIGTLLCVLIGIYTYVLLLRGLS